MKSLRGSKAWFVSLLLVLAMVAAACGGDDDEGTDAGSGDDGDGAATQETVSLTMSMSTCSPYYYGYHIAEALGFFEEEGIDLKQECSSGSSEVASILAAGTADLGAAGFSAMLPAMAASDNVNPFFVHTYGEPYDILVLADSGIDEVADLEGKTMGVSDLAGGEMPLVRALISNAGLVPEEDVQFLEVSENPGTVQVAFERDDIVAYASGVSTTSIFPATGIDTVSILPEFVGDLAAGGLMATEEWKDNVDVLARVGRAAAKGHLVGFANHDAAICVMKDVIPAEFEDEEAGRASFEGSLLATTAPENDDGTYDFGRGVADVDQWNEYINIYFEAGVLDEAFDPSPYLVDVKDEINNFDQQEIIDMANELPTDC